MPREDRLQRAARRATSAERWSAYITPALNASGMTTAQIHAATNGEIDRQLISKWRNAEQAANPYFAALIAEVLHLDMTQTLREAGHGTLIDRVTAAVRGRRTPDAAARAFGTWLRSHAGERGLDPDYFLEATRPESPFARDTFASWWEGRTAPDPVNAALIGVILDVDPVDALRAAGHDDVADTAAAIRQLQDPHVRTAKRLVGDPDIRRRLIAEYEDRLESERRHAGEVLELKAKAAGGDNGGPPNAP